MTLAAGTRLGPYEIVAPIGAGGMGEVYKARDTRLERTVAIKVLPQHLSASPESSPALRARGEDDLAALALAHLRAVRRRATRTASSTWSWSCSRARRWRIGWRKGALPREQTLRYGHRDRRRAGQGAPAGDRPPGPEARQRDADEVGGEAARLRAGEGDGAGGAGLGSDVAADGDGQREPEPDAGRDDPRDVPVHGAGAARGQARRTRGRTSSRSAASSTRWRRGGRRSPERARRL